MVAFFFLYFQRFLDRFQHANVTLISFATVTQTVSDLPRSMRFLTFKDRRANTERQYQICLSKHQTAMEADLSIT